MSITKIGFKTSHCLLTTHCSVVNIALYRRMVLYGTATRRTCNKSRAMAGRTARCHCKFQYVSNFTAAACGFPVSQHGFLVYISDLSNAEITHSMLGWFSRPWQNF